MTVLMVSYCIVLYCMALPSAVSVGTLTPRLLDILKTKDIRVTFFVMGIKAAMHPDIIKRAHDEGHEIANHAWDHPVLTKIARDKVLDQLHRTSATIEGIIHDKPAVMRPPYGNTNGRLNNFIFDHEKLSVILWSYDTQGMVIIRIHPHLFVVT